MTCNSRDREGQPVQIEHYNQATLSGIWSFLTCLLAAPVWIVLFLAGLPFVIAPLDL